MRAFENLTRIVRHSFGSSASRLVPRPAVLGGLASALVAMLVLASCGMSKQAAGPDTGAGGEPNPGSPTSGQPSAQFAYSTSELDLIKSTTGTSDWVTVLAAPIKMPASKELYVNASLETGLYTQTLASSKNNKKDTSTASVAIQVRALIDNQPMPPGTVTYAARTQTLSATLEGAIAGCLTTVVNGDGTTSIIVDQNCVTPETIELILTTLNAASFNFVASNVPVGTHTISLQARISSTTSVDTGTASATALVGKGTMIAQIVRAVK